MLEVLEVLEVPALGEELCQFMQAMTKWLAPRQCKDPSRSDQAGTSIRSPGK